MKTITLAQWKADKELELRSFELYWKSRCQEEDSDLPESLSKKEWDEQFSFFVEEV